MKFRYLYHPLTAEDRHWLLIMGLAFIAGFAAVCCTSCAARTGWARADGSSGYAALNVGIGEQGVSQSATAYAAAEADGRDAFRDLRIAAQTASIGDTLTQLGKSGTSAFKSRQTTNREAIRAARDTELSRHAAGVETTRILNPDPPQS